MMSRCGVGNRGLGYGRKARKSGRGLNWVGLEMLYLRLSSLTFA
jgi:hypothetical protein